MRSPHPTDRVDHANHYSRHTARHTTCPECLVQASDSTIHSRPKTCLFAIHSNMLTRATVGPDHSFYVAFASVAHTQLLVLLTPCDTRYLHHALLDTHSTRYSQHAILVTTRYSHHALVDPHTTRFSLPVVTHTTRYSILTPRDTCYHSLLDTHSTRYSLPLVTHHALLDTHTTRY